MGALKLGNANGLPLELSVPYLPIARVRKMTKLAFAGSGAKAVNKEALFTIIKASESLLTMLSEQSVASARKAKRKSVAPSDFAFNDKS